MKMEKLIIPKTKRLLSSIKFLQERVTMTGTVLSGLIEKYNVSDEEIKEIIEEAEKEKHIMMEQCRIKKELDNLSENGKTR